MVRRAKPFVGIGVCAAAVAAGFLVASAWMAPTSAADDGDQEARESSAQPVRRRRPTDPRRQALQGLNPLEHLRRGEHVVSPLPNGRQAELSIEAGLQEHLEQLLERYEVPFAGVVAMEPDSGRVLAYVSHSSANPDAGDLVLDPTPPTASVFKVVTGAALVDAGVSIDTEVCYTGGGSRITAWHLQDHEHEARCATLSEAMGRSTNAIFAKLADRHLNEATLERYAAAFGFGHGLPFDVATRPSPAEVPSDRLERARTAAGFWHMHMSPLHGALIASTIANDGQMPRATLVDRVVDEDGNVELETEASIFRNVIPRHTARQVNRMMRQTVSAGTARRQFRDPQGRPFLPDVVVAGKTGTLSAERPYRGYTWFIGFAPADDPQIAVAAVVVNTPRWRIKAPLVAREALRYHLFEGEGRQGAN